MYFSCTRQELLSGINAVQKAASNKLSLEILRGIKIEIEDGVITYSATDLEIGIQAKQTLIDAENGAVVVPAKLFAEIAKKLPVASTITCTQKDNVLEISYKGSSIEITAMSADEFPVMPEIEGEEIEIESTSLKKELTKVRFAVATEQNRPVFTGVLFNFTKGNLDLVGTDTHRLALAKMPLEGFCGDLKAIIPSLAVDEILRLQDGLKLKIRQQGGQFCFEAGDIKIFSRVIEGQFPNYSQVIPKSWTSRVEVNCREFAGVIDRASIIRGDALTVVDGLRIESSDAKGKINEHYEVKTEGEPIKVSFNPAFLIAALKAMDSENITMELNGEHSPIVMREDGYLHLILPVRVQ